MAFATTFPVILAAWNPCIKPIIKPTIKLNKNSNSIKDDKTKNVIPKP